ncbi:hypothetical protein BGZ46_008763 [Entomortierella lignicola]|nr:hypothetical protein BGZ46_008763 [Entomortierella lignicola]
MPTSHEKSKNRNNKKKDKTKKATEPQTSPKNPDSNDRAPSPPEIESQYHHYIPRFILKNADGAWLEKLLKRKKLDEGFEGPPIKIYDANAKIITIGDISKSYGIQDMYRDISLKDCMKFEKLLGKFESSAAKFVNAIVSGSNDISISRVGLFEFKQFLFIMMYRNESRRGQYLQEEFDDRTRFLIEKHMRFNNISNIQEVWFENLKWILDNPEKKIMNEVGRANMAFCQPDNFRGSYSKDAHFDALNGYDGPINVMELLDFEMLAKKYICIWEAPEGTEFILSDNDFGNHEKQSGIFIHNFFVVSPRLWRRA